MARSRGMGTCIRRTREDAEREPKSSTGDGAGCSRRVDLIYSSTGCFQGASGMQYRHAISSAATISTCLPVLKLSFERRWTTKKSSSHVAVRMTRSRKAILVTMDEFMAANSAQHAAVRL